MSNLTEKNLINIIKKLIIEANTELRPDVLEALGNAAHLEENENGKKALDMLLKNAMIASQEKLPICQDTGYVDVFFEMPTNLLMSVAEVCSGSLKASIDGDLKVAATQPPWEPEGFRYILDLQKIANEAVRQVYTEQNYRHSVVADPFFERKNTGDNTPANIFITPIIKDDRLKIRVLIKGAGSDNSSAVFMLNPTVSEKELQQVILDHVKENAAKSCPPVIIGIGIGSSFDKVASIAKKALLKPVNCQRSMVNGQQKYSELEQKILREVNNLGIGPSGLGGKTTALAVNIEKAPCHMATLPLAINLNCYALRSASITVRSER